MGETSRTDAIEPQIPSNELKGALEEQLHRTLPPLLAGLIVLYAYLTIASPLFDPLLRGRWDLPVILLTCGQLVVWSVVVALAVAYRRGWVPAGRAHRVAWAIATLPLLDSLAHMLVRPDPLETLTSILVFLGAAITYTSWRHF
ncbi:MAG: hypothetical protein ACK46X_20385, partial [Candidatus Sericytochromatia bacterium]